VNAALALLADLRPDVVLLTRFDHDLRAEALGAFADRLADMGLDYPYRLAPAQNRGLPSGEDLDGDGRKGGREDAHGYGRFRGAGAMAILSRHPLGPVLDYASFLWADLPDARLSGVPAPVRGLQRLSSSAHWVVPVDLPGGGVLHLMAWAATPPLFGTGTRNLDRNHDEAAFWLNLLDARLPFAPPPAPFAVLGLANAEPGVGAGDGAAMAALAAHPALQPPVTPPSFTLRDGPARLSVLMPGAGLTVVAAGAGTAEGHRHALIWADVQP